MNKLYFFETFYKKINIFFLLSILFLLLTNNYFGEHNINSSGTSGFYYLEIAKSFPLYPKLQNTEASYIHAQRYLVSYMVGILKYNLKISAFLTFQILSYLFIFIFLLTSKFIIQHFKISEISKIFLLGLILFNPYLARYFISNPLMLNDICFFVSINLLILSFLKKNNSLFFIGLILAIIARQTHIIIFIAYFFVFIFFTNRSIFIDKFKIFIGLFLIIINFIFTLNYIDAIGLNNFNKGVYLGLINFLKYNFDLFKLINFLLYPLFSFGPIILLLFYLIYKKNIKINLSENSIFLIFLILGIISQPIITGPELTGKNIIRLSSYSYLPLISLILLNTSIKEVINKHLFKYSILFIILWSLHPTFSKILVFLHLFN